jgi:uncharacterized protein YndB with AHSA1/START domain
METKEKTIITVAATVNAPIAKVWECWSNPDHITKWKQASEDWHCPWAKNTLREGSSFVIRMESKDGTMGFDFGGVYDVIREHEYIEYTMGDGRKVWIRFQSNGGATDIEEKFVAENEHPIDMQQGGWQAILNNFKGYVEGLE